MSECSFDLIEEPWIPCATQDGRLETLGLGALFARAHELRGIEHANPLTEAALLRVLLAIVHRAVNGPRNGNEWKEVYRRGRFDERLATYLARWSHRFDLFSPDAPFYQTPGLQMVDSEDRPAQPQSVRCLMVEAASGNNKTLFDHTIDDAVVRLSPAKAALAVITAQQYSLGGLNRKSTNFFGHQFRFENSPMVDGIYVTLTGRSVFETIVLNLLILSDNQPIPDLGQDCPVWERQDRAGVVLSRKKAPPPRGYLDLLTCASRHITLVPESGEAGVYVERLHIAQGEMFCWVRDPGFVVKTSKKGVPYNAKLEPDRALWRDSLALFAFDLASDARPRAFRQAQEMRTLVDLPNRYICTAHALANADANPLAWRRERLNVPTALLTDADVVASLIHAMSVADAGLKALEGAVWVYITEVLPPSPPKTISAKGKATGAARTYWDALESGFQRFMLDLEDPETALTNWVAAIKHTAREAMSSCVKGRYRDSARSYRAWSLASAILETRLANLAP